MNDDFHLRGCGYRVRVMSLSVHANANVDVNVDVRIEVVLVLVERVHPVEVAHLRAREDRAYECRGRRSGDCVVTTLCENDEMKICVRVVA